MIKTMNVMNLYVQGVRRFLRDSFVKEELIFVPRILAKMGRLVDLVTNAKKRLMLCFYRERYIFSIEDQQLPAAKYLYWRFLDVEVSVVKKLYWNGIIRIIFERL